MKSFKQFQESAKDLEDLIRGNSPMKPDEHGIPGTKEHFIGHVGSYYGHWKEYDSKKMSGYPDLAEHHRKLYTQHLDTLKKHYSNPKSSHGTNFGQVLGQGIHSASDNLPHKRHKFVKEVGELYDRYYK